MATSLLFLRQARHQIQYKFAASAVDQDKLEPADPVAHSVGYCISAWTQNYELIHALRHELGRYIEGSRSTMPTAQVRNM
jgi:hypothetical protein